MNEQAQKATVDLKKYWLIRKKIVFGVMTVMVVIALSMILAVPHYSDYSERAQVAEVMNRLFDAKKQIADNLMSSQPIDPQAVKRLIPDRIVFQYQDGKSHQIDFKDVTDQGEIRVYVSGLGAMLIVTPHMENNEVEWTCRGWPKRSMIMVCRFD